MEKTVTKDIAKVLIRTRSCSTNCVLASYLSDFIHKITECCEQELTSGVISSSKFIFDFSEINLQQILWNEETDASFSMNK